MTNKDLKYCHNFREPIYPHQQLPEKGKKRAKRTKNDEADTRKDEDVETGNNDESSANKRKIKRQVKKMESDVLKSGGLEKAGNSISNNKGESQEMNPVTT